MPVEAGVLEGLSGLVGRLRQVGQERRGHPLVHVGRGLPSGHVDGQLVHHAFQRVGRRHCRQGGVVGGGDATVHCCRGGMIAELQIHRSGRALAVDLDLEGFQSGLAGLGGEAQGQTRVDGREAGSVGGDEALRRGEVRGQGVGGEVRGCGQGGHLALQGRDGGRVGADVGGVLGAGFQRRVLGEDEAELPGGDALQLDDRRLGDAVVQHSARECGRE